MNLFDLFTSINMLERFISEMNCLGMSAGHLGCIFERSLGPLGRQETALGEVWEMPGASWTDLGASELHFGCVLEVS